MSGKRRAKAPSDTDPKRAPQGVREAPRVNNAARDANVLAVACVALAVILAYGARNELNPDGVSYLDLAAALRAGAFSNFVQGYWSPLYPALLALVGASTGHGPASLVRDVHALNVLIAVGAIAAVWWTVRTSANVALVRLSFGALLLCAWRPPRVDAVTPDLLLLALMILITWELVLNHGRRWLLLGVLFGLAFLAKTSAWPWLIVTLVVRLWFSKRNGSARVVWLSSAVCAVVMMMWIVPLSMQSKKITVGDAGALNACWYLEKCDSRTPDTHVGEHVSYQTAMYNGDVPIKWATFGTASVNAAPPDPALATTGFHWTYLPWSDPSAWAKGVTTRASVELHATDLVLYWLMLARYVFAYWLVAMILAVLVPACILFCRKNSFGALRTAHADSLLAMVFGFVGIGQFIAVHAEPRLVAPFALMFALAMLVWLCDAAAEAIGASGNSSVRAQQRFGKWFTFLSFAGVIAAIPFAMRSAYDSYGKEFFAQERVDAISMTRAALGQAGLTNQRIVVVGYAIPVIADAYRQGNYIVAQVLPESAARIAAFPPDEQRRLIDQFFAGRADVAWFSNANGGFRILPIRKF